MHLHLHLHFPEKSGMLQHTQSKIEQKKKLQLECNNVNDQEVSCDRCGRLCVGRIYFSMVSVQHYCRDSLSLSRTPSKSECTPSVSKTHLLFSYFSRFYFLLLLLLNLDRALLIHGINSTANIQYTTSRHVWIPYGENWKSRLEHMCECAFSILENEFIYI